MNRNDAFPSKYLTAADLNSKPALFVISGVEMVELRDTDGNNNTKPCISFQNQEKGMICNVTNWTLISDFLGDESDDWTGKEIVLFPERVRSPQGGLTWGIRVRAPVKKPKTLAPAPKQKLAAAALVESENPADGMDDEIGF